MNSVSKVYDIVSYSRLKQWLRPLREQAGSQENRGCIEHIVSLRLLCDMARIKKLKLLVTFIDCRHAYDRVQRNTFCRVLHRFVCGAVMLCALVAIYTETESLIGSAVVSITMEVRQGSPTSCLLFMIYVNELIRMINESCGQECFLQRLHRLVLMDDTVLLVTTRCNMLVKLSILQVMAQSHQLWQHTPVIQYPMFLYFLLL